jgi:hypothetical protein
VIDDRSWLERRCRVPGHEAPKEEAFCRAMMTTCRDPIGLYGGSGMSGKSHTLRTFAFWCLACLRDWGFPGQRFMLASADYPTLEGRQITKIVEEFQGMGEYRVSHKVHGRCFVFHDKTLGVICLRNLKDPDAYRGTEVAGVGIEEATELPERFGFVRTLELLRYPIRSPLNLPVLPIAMVSNPDGVGWRWIKQLFIDRDLRAFKLRPQQVIFQQALVEDNPYAGEAGMAMLNSLTGTLYQARRLGNWDAPEGARFPTLNRMVHRFSLKHDWPHGLPQGWRLLLGQDWGKAAPYCALWIAIDPDGDAWVYREDYRSGLNDPVQAKRIHNLTGENEQISAWRCDPSMWAHTQSSASEDEPGRPHIEFFEDEMAGDDRFPAPTKGYNRSRSTAMATIDMLLQRPGDYPEMDEAGISYPNLYIEEECENLWNELSGAVWDKDAFLGGKKEDIDEQCPDHALTALYYAMCGEIEPHAPPPRDEDVIDGEAAQAAWRQERHEHALAEFGKRNTLWGRR